MSLTSAARRGNLAGCVSAIKQAKKNQIGCRELPLLRLVLADKDNSLRLWRLKDAIDLSAIGNLGEMVKYGMKYKEFIIVIKEVNEVIFALERFQSWWSRASVSDLDSDLLKECLWPPGLRQTIILGTRISSSTESLFN